MSVEHGGRRWPVIEGIPFLRVGREALADEALDLLERGDATGALALLLTDRDDWAPGDAPTPADTAAVVAAVDAGATLRDAMHGLGYGPVADYFAHRWSDPTFLSGLALLREAWPVPRPVVVEIACGIGQLLAAAGSAGATTIGVDVVFSKLWLTRRFVAARSELLCADIERGPLPLADDAADLVVLHDALYFLDDKAAVLAEARRVGSSIAVGHAHNALVDNLSSGRPLDPDAWAALLPGASCFDDLELTAAWLDDRAPRARPPGELGDAAAIAMIDGPIGTVRPRLDQPRPGRPLHLNPLFEAGHGDPVPLFLRWPSSRYRREYASISRHLDQPTVPAAVLARAAAGRVDDPAVAELARRRVVLDLPERW